MFCSVFIFIISILVCLIIPLAWESCYDVPQLNQESMTTALSSVVFGQELAIHIVTLSLQTHLERLKANIHHPLLLSFHGSSGVGKTFISSQISHLLPANTRVVKYHPSIHLKAGKTANVHEISAWINEQTSFCRWTIIVVDDAQDVSDEMQAAFKKVLNNMQASWLYRKTIVIFVSNMYSNEINDVVFNKVKQKGPSTFYVSDFDPVFERGPSSWLMELHREGLLHAFVPFLPLDKNTVLKCIEQELKQYNKIPFQEIVNEISNEIVFYTLEGKDYQYSISGCKKVSDKVALWLNSL